MTRSKIFDQTFVVYRLLTGSEGTAYEEARPAEDLEVGELTKEIDTLYLLLEELFPGPTSHEPEEAVWSWIGTADEAAEGKGLTDWLKTFAGDLFYYSDRWCLGRFKRSQHLWTMYIKPALEK